MGGKSGGSQTSTTVQQPTLEQRTLAKIQLGEAQDRSRINQFAQDRLLGTDDASFQNRLPEFFPGQLVAGFTPDQLQAQDFARTRAGQLQQTLPSQIEDLIQFGTQDVLDTQGELTQNLIRSSANAVTDNFLENVFPQIGSAAQQAGAFGGSRQGVLEAQTAEDLNRQVADISNQLSFQAFQRGLDTFDRTLPLVPALQQSTFLPADILSRIGAEQQQLDQANIAADVARHDFNQNREFDRIMQVANISNLLQGGTGAIGLGGSSTTTADGPAGPSRLQTGLAGAATGAAAGAAMGAGFGPWGAAIGGVIGLLG